MMMSISALGQNIDQYKIRKQVTIKNFTELFVAYDEDNKRWVALELLLPEFENSPLHADLARRATAVSQLNHPHISPIYQVSPETRAPAYIASQLVKGFPLSQRLEQLASQPSPVQTRYALRLIHQIAQALASAEKETLVHYDLRPENIIIQPDDTVTILDLHLPRNTMLVENMIHSGLEDRLAYYAPEQLANKPMDGRSTVYTLGILLFEMLTGQLPSQDAVVWERLYRNLRQRPSELALYRSGLSPECYQVVDRAIQPERLLRFSGLAEMLVALERAIIAEEERHIAPNVSSVLHENRNLRNYVLFPAVLALICGLLLFSGYAYVTQNSEEVGDSLVASLPIPATAVFTPTPPPPPTLETQSGGSGSALPSLPTNTPTPTAPPSQTPTAEPTATQTAVPTITTTPSPEPITNPIVEIIFSSVSVRTGPNTNFDIILFLYEGDEVAVLAQTAFEPRWYNVQLSSGETGWLSANVSRPTTGGDPVEVPIVATLPPSPTPTNTAVPTNTPVPTAQPTAANPGGGNGGGGGGGGNPTPDTRPTLTPPFEPPTLTPPSP